MMRRRSFYAVLAGALALGAPAGLLLLRIVRRGSIEPEFLRGELSTSSETYAYVTVTTLIAFTAFGFVLGRVADRLREQSTTDPLTGLWNRRYLLERFEAEFARARRYRTPITVILLDVDRLKELNDTAGHAAGDRALQRTATLLRAAARETDVVARWGGDEFLVLAPQTSSVDAEVLAARIFRLADQGPPGPELRTLSAGVATLVPRGAGSAEDLVRVADESLYAAKRAGRRRIVVAPEPAKDSRET
jgi:diguanylate cyclase (GGDEF)-like protein